jgi:predicted DNA-binding transcriptional regulator YafY
MKKFINDFIRQAEILAHCLNGLPASKAEYASMYGIEEITIDRDLRVLRELGVQIYSKKGKVVISEVPGKEILQKISSDYLPIELNSDVFIKQVKLLSKTNKQNYFQILVLLAKAVKEGLIVEFRYKRLSDNEISDYKVIPIRLFTNELNWILHSFKVGEDTLKKFYLSRIIELKITDKKYTQSVIPEGKKEIYSLILRFNPKVSGEVYSKLWFEEFEIGKDKAGYIILKTKQPITNKLAGWCISWWNMIEILEPVELREYIGEMIHSFNVKNQLNN